ncbi:TBC1 domain family member 15-like isoform X2 [Histomonas meleagridis]|uniref:TBC1 domain family member 15-like isoform X2 n=1 Tax=Histomonas meleagridis TaxID=135588 RepID=UPI003559D29E|nr:TBC1 domain family member 15-like isoform X2 [Histomonas meleagridis]KAH0802788.1 TBC1 domain family member 15-like isoform X2 [Histomonas meleagridis]
MKKNETLQMIEHVLEQKSEEKVMVDGTLFLTKEGESFFIGWYPIEENPAKHFDQTKIEREEKWDEGLPFKFDCAKIRIFSLKEKDNDLILSIENDSYVFVRQFFLPKDSNGFAISSLIQQLLSNGIAVLHHDDTTNYEFTFYQNYHGNSISSVPFLEYTIDSKITSLADYWNSITNYSYNLIKEMNDDDLIPSDINFPFGIASQSIHYLVLQKIDTFIEGLPHYTPVTSSDLPSLFDADGKIQNSELFRKRLFFAGCDSDVLLQLLPFIFNVYPLDSTTAERKSIDQTHQAIYDRLESQLECISDLQLSHNKKLVVSFKVIVNDVNRTDRVLPAFAESDSIGLQILKKVLQLYCLYRMDISYLQGMNDLFVPIVLTHYPNWNEKGFPVDANGERIEVDKSTMSSIFWCFVSMVENIGHQEILENVTAKCSEMAKIVIDVISKVSPIVALWLKKYVLENLIWIYSDFILLYKRTFPDIWGIWTQFNCAPDPKHWLIYYGAASLLLLFPKLSQIKEVNITAVMSVFPSEIEKIDPRKIGMVAYWIYENAKIEVNEEVKERESTKKKFEFFETE